MEITNQEIIDSVNRLNIGHTIYVELDGDITSSNYSSVFFIKSMSQMEIDGDNYGDFSIETQWTDVYNEVVRVNRKNKYGSWESQLEMQVDGTWEKHIADVKSSLPFLL